MGIKPIVDQFERDLNALRSKSRRHQIQSTMAANFEAAAGGGG